MIAANRRSGGRKHFRREYDKKVQVLGLLTVLALPDAALPPELVAGLDRLLGGTTALLAALKRQQVPRFASFSVRVGAMRNVTSRSLLTCFQVDLG